MPRTVDHIVETHRVAQARRDVGQPIWAHRIDVSHVFHNEDMTFEQRRDAIVRILRASPWLREDTGNLMHLWTLQELVDELAETRDGDEFDGPWDALYDEADYDRVWIRTI